MNMQFRKFLIEESHQKKKEPTDVDKTIQKLPSKFQKLLKGYSFKFESGNTLSGDKEHVGVNDMEKKIITVCSPWNYGREFTFLHEIGHIVWAKFVAPFESKTQQWSRIVKRTKRKLNQNAEELFCHAFANTYASHKVLAHNHTAWEKFVKSI